MSSTKLIVTTPDGKNKFEVDDSEMALRNFLASLGDHSIIGRIAFAVYMFRYRVFDTHVWVYAFGVKETFLCKLDRVPAVLRHDSFIYEEFTPVGIPFKGTTYEDINNPQLDRIGSVINRERFLTKSELMEFIKNFWEITTEVSECKFNHYWAYPDITTSEGVQYWEVNKVYRDLIAAKENLDKIIPSPADKTLTKNEVMFLFDSVIGPAFLSSIAEQGADELTIRRAWDKARLACLSKETFTIPNLPKG